MGRILSQNLDQNLEDSPQPFSGCRTETSFNLCIFHMFRTPMM